MTDRQTDRQTDIQTSGTTIRLTLCERDAINIDYYIFGLNPKIRSGRPYKQGKARERDIMQHSV